MNTAALTSCLRLVALVVGVCGLGAMPLAAAGDARLLVISVDGLRPDYVTEADKHGYQIPTLRKLLAESAYSPDIIFN